MSKPTELELLADLEKITNIANQPVEPLTSLDEIMDFRFSQRQVERDVTLRIRRCMSPLDFLTGETAWRCDFANHSLSLGEVS